jgi:hypothetical protein
MATIKLDPDDRTLFVGIIEQLQANTEAIQAKGDSDSQNTLDRGKSEGALSGILNRISIGIPGTGIRLFGLGEFLTGINNAKTAAGKLAVGMSQTAVAALALQEGLFALGKSLGGITGREAMGQAAGAFGQSIAGLGEGRLRFPGRTLRVMGAGSQEFGGLINPEAAARLGDVATDLGISSTQLMGLERVFQANLLGTEEAVNQFKQVGIGGAIAAEELKKNSGAVARAGGEFNKFIVASIANAKKLGLEFSEMDKTLTGFSTDFEGTVGSFSQLRAVIPGFAVDFGELMTTSLTGTTEEYTELIRSGLIGAGVGVNTQLRRDQAALLQQATGFSEDQIQRIIDGQEVDIDMKAQLDTERNSLLKTNIMIASAGFGAVVGSLIAIAPWSALGAAISAGGGAMTGIALGTAVGAVAGAGIAGGMDDFVYRPGQPPIPFNSRDTIIGVKNPASLGGGVDPNAIAGAMASAMNGMTVEMRDIDKAVMRLPEIAIRNA